MTERVFVDSNILIYAYDLAAGEKQGIAAKVLRSLWQEKVGVISPQVLQEFYFIITSKVRMPLRKQKAREIVDLYREWCTTISAEEIAAAFRIEDEARISFWDALIVASAAASGARRILTEDLNHAQVISGVRVENPFVTGRPSN